MMCKTRCCLLLSTAVIFACLAGCARTQATRYYTLIPMEGSPQEEAGRPPGVVGVGPVTVPEYLDRPQMAGMAGPNEVDFAEFHRWAEPLDTMLTRVIVDNLAVLLGTERVAAFPWPDDVKPGVMAEVEVISFVGRPGGGVTLEARWRVRTAGDEGSVRRTQVEMPAEAGDYASLAAAASQAVASLSREIADAIEAMSG